VVARFAPALFAQLRDAPGNVVCSPVSVALALAMAAEGARGETQRELHAVLGDVPAPPDPGAVRLHVANRLFGERAYAFHPAFLERLRDAYGAPPALVDFAGDPDGARVQINAWVAEQTQARIRDLIAPGAVTPDTRLALVNALYFLADWETPFDSGLTHDAPFAGTRDVPTMHRTGVMGHVAIDGWAAVELPYRDSALAMLVVLPDAIGADLPLGVLTAGLTAQRVALSLPKFTVDPAQALELTPALRALGIRLAFDRFAADFRGIADPPDPDDRLSISDVFHKAFVKVDEEGTEAAAATALLMQRAAGIPEPAIAFRVDRPFLFAIRDRASGQVLFLGRVTDPLA